jgi:hypothetical protein
MRNDYPVRNTAGVGGKELETKAPEKVSAPESEIKIDWGKDIV